jgi:hypothetical protein
MLPIVPDRARHQAIHDALCSCQLPFRAIVAASNCSAGEQPKKTTAGLPMYGRKNALSWVQRNFLHESGNMLSKVKRGLRLREAEQAQSTGRSNQCMRSKLTHITHVCTCQ